MTSTPLSHIKHIELILKLTARCNINCSYCYYFYGADSKWSERPKRIDEETLNDTIIFLKESIYKHGISSIQIDFHGGEPLLYGKKQFEQACDLFLNALNDIVNLKFAIQTNAILIDDEWIALFKKYQVSVSVSLDGPPQINDQYRIDHQNKGTYHKVANGLQQLKNAVQKMEIPNISTLAVINPHASGKMVYRHFVDILGLKHMDFLLPGFDYDTYQVNDLPLYGDYLMDVLNEWITDDNPSIKIRLFGAFVAKLYGESTFMFPGEKFENKDAIAITVDTDGMMYGDDSLRSNQAWNHYKALSITEHNFSTFVAAEKEWFTQNIKTPIACQNCIWVDMCGGGHLENRFSSKNGYHNPSIYCDSLQRIYQQILHFLIDSGISFDHLNKHIPA